MEKTPFISIIVPCLNEERFIAKCLDSLLGQNFANNKMQILVVDGMSDDKTREVVKEYRRKHPFIELVDNPKKFTTAALNIGAKGATGDIIFIISAHSEYCQDYFTKCIKYLREYGADNAGGVLRTLPADDSLAAKAIAYSLSSPFGVGNSYFRKGLDKPKLVDAAASGCFKKEIFQKIGFFNENLVRNQDVEFNLRIRAAGGKIILAPDIVITYYPKSKIGDFFTHNFKDAFWVTYPLKFGARSFSWRHLIPCFFITALLATGIIGIFYLKLFFLFLIILGLYFFVSFYFSFLIAIREKDARYLIVMPIVFFVRHSGHGLGSAWGLLKSII